MKNWHLILIVGISFFCGVLVNMLFQRTPDPVIKEKIVETVKPIPYPVVDTLRIPEPVEIPGEPVPVYITVPADTAEIVADYLIKRKYTLDFSSDTLGTYKVDVDIQANRLISGVSTIRPIIRTITKEKTIYKTEKLQFYGIVGTSVDFRTNKVQFGIDLNQKFLIGVSGIRLDNNYGYTIDFGTKF